MATTLTAIRGMNDVLPDEAPLWERFEDTARTVFAQYGYRNIRIPIVEQTPLFVRGIGDATDIVEHEMYTFEDKLNGESLTLRPEATSASRITASEGWGVARFAFSSIMRASRSASRLPQLTPMRTGLPYSIAFSIITANCGSRFDPLPTLPGLIRNLARERAQSG